MLLTANKARSTLTGSVTSAAGQVAAITASSGALFVGVGGVATNSTLPALIRCVLTAVDTNGNDTGSYEIVDVTRSGDNLTLVNRGLEGTTAAAWTAGTVIECRPTAGGLIAMGPSGIISGVGGSGLTATTMTSLMPGATAISIPVGMLAAGDAVILEGAYGHVGSTTAFSVDVIVNSFFGSIGGFGPVAGNAGVWTRLIIAIRSLTEQTLGGIASAGGGFNGANAHYAFNLASVALTLDFQAKFNTAPAGGETLQLDWYSVEIKKAG